jgi:hypothetical protein
MEIKELIGKYAIRTLPTGDGDHSYMDSPLKITYADEYNIVAHNMDSFSKGSFIVLRAGWIDKNWRECPKEILEAYGVIDSI